MTIDLGFAWTALPSGRTVAFVDVPGHERFVTTMLAGVGPCPAAMIVVAADEGWCVQSGEHLAALDLLGVRHGLLVITRADLADPAPALAEARSRLRGTCLETIPALAVSGVTGQGLPKLATALDRLAAGLPPPATDGPVRLWADRVFTVTGAGVVVTGTLTAGTLRAGQTLHLGGEPVRVRGLQTLNTPAGVVTATARVAVNLRGPVSPSRGDALLTPGAWHLTTSADVWLSPGEPPKGDLLLHIGSAAVPTRIRPLGEGAARLSFARPLPLRVGDRALLRNPSHSAVTTGVVVLDVRPPTLTRRGRRQPAARHSPRPEPLREPGRTHRVRETPYREAGYRGRPICCAGTGCSAAPTSRRWASPRRPLPCRAAGTPIRSTGRDSGRRSPRR
ncbi:GTP-binding protein [Nonomuraea antimicrobica]